MSEKLRLTFKLFWNFVIQPVREQKRNQIRQRNEEKKLWGLKGGWRYENIKGITFLVLAVFLVSLYASVCHTNVSTGQRIQ